MGATIQPRPIPPGRQAIHVEKVDYLILICLAAALFIVIGLLNLTDLLFGGIATAGILILMAALRVIRLERRDTRDDSASNGAP